MDTKPLRKDFASDEEFNKAMLIYNKAKQEEAPSLSKFVSPKVVELSGALTQISSDPIKGTGGAFRIGTMSSGDRFVCSEAVFQSNKELLTLGNVLDVKCEERIALKTGYIDQKGNEVAHTKNGLGFISASFEPEFLKSLAKGNKENATRQAEIDGAVEVVAKAIASASEKDKEVIGKSLQIAINFNR